MVLFDLEKTQLVPFQDMNEVHLEEMALGNEIFEHLQNTTPVDHKWLQLKLRDFLYHTRDHFKFEEEIMKETLCPILSSHESEHNRVLAIMIQIFKDYMMSADTQILKDYFECEFKPWIEHHILTMDTVTATYLESYEKGESIPGLSDHQCGTSKC